MEKPLHVQVAEALGCRSELSEAYDDGWQCGCYDRIDVSACPVTGNCTGGEIARYDTDWSATGPLIERLGIHLSKVQGVWWADSEVAETGPTPLIAVCNLILALKAAGKLAS